MTVTNRSSPPERILIEVITSPSAELIYFVQCIVQYTMQCTVHYSVQCRLECQVLFTRGKKGWGGALQYLNQLSQ